jgi:hypothetical protein
MKITDLKKRLQAEFNFSEEYDKLDGMKSFDTGTILLSPHFTQNQRPWVTKAYNEWLYGGRTIVLIVPQKSTCKYFKKYLTDVAEVRRIKEPLYYDKYNGIISMIIAVYWKREIGERNFIVTFD